MMPSKEELEKYLENRKEAAAKYNVSEKTIINWMKKYNLYFPKPRLGLEIANQIRGLHSSGHTCKDLAKQFQISHAAVCRIINEETYSLIKEKADIKVIYNISN